MRSFLPVIVALVTWSEVGSEMRRTNPVERGPLRDRYAFEVTGKLPE
jgi:hypothetical protein